jgi:hypothetical protein
LGSDEMGDATWFHAVSYKAINTIISKLWVCENSTLLICCAAEVKLKSDAKNNGQK